MWLIRSGRHSSTALGRPSPECSIMVVIAWFALANICAFATLAGAEACDSNRTLFVRGSPITGGVNGIVFDGQDRLYAASVFSSEIVVLDPSNGEILERYGKERGVENPDDLFVSPDGSIFWTAIFTGDVGRLWPNGEGRVVAKLGPGVNPITMSDDGRLFVGLCFFGNGLYEVDPEGARAPRSVTDELTGECSINGMDFGPDGRLFGPTFFNGTVVGVDVDDGEVEVVGKGFDRPVALKFDGRGVAHVLDLANLSVSSLDVSTGRVGNVRTLSDQHSPDNLAFDSADRLFVSHQDSAILEIMGNGSMRAVLPGGLTNPSGLAVVARPDGGESVFAGSMTSMNEFDGATGELIYAWTANFEGSDFQGTFTMATDGSRLLVTTAFTNSVQILDPVARSILVTRMDFDTPLNAIFFRDGFLVSEMGSEGVVLASVSNSSQRTVLARDLGLFTGLAATEDNAWGVEWTNGSLFQLVKDGSPVGEPVVVATGLQRPEGMAVWRDGRLLVVETGAGRLSLVDPKSGDKVVVEEGLALGLEALPQQVPTWTFSDVAVSPSGSVYVNSDKDNALYRIDIEGCTRE
ncbi:unnamed protein product [Ostreobium quekettii]|uniref:SMP-30/Gluconolactonase/LRE-like region domain-containing protein n=1 Tax=Ostreobium quekettii TaxID=121088 RepID=A0A8S1J8Z8_9CHLO|nr:unnamed protein product [Ostreobium quekettii]